jgi:hypothetical protein
MIAFACHCRIFVPGFTAQAELRLAAGSKSKKQSLI